MSILTIDIAKTASLALFCVMQATCPIDGNVALLAIESCGAFHGSAGTDAAELEQSVKDRAIITDIVLGLFPHITVHIVRGDPSEELDVFVGVELCHLVDNRRLRTLYTFVALASVRGAH